MFTFCITQLHICHDFHEPLHPSSIPKHKCDHITRSNNLHTANSKQHSADSVWQTRRGRRTTMNHWCSTRRLQTKHTALYYYPCWDISLTYLVHTLIHLNPKQDIRNMSFVHIWCSCQKKSPTANKIQIHTRCMQMYFYLLSLPHPFVSHLQSGIFPCAISDSVVTETDGGIVRGTSTRGEISMCLLLGYKLLLTASVFLFYPFASISLCMFCVFFLKRLSLSLRLYFT